VSAQRVPGAPGASSGAAYAIETVVARMLVIGTWVAVGLILVGVLGMIAAGIDPMAHPPVPAFDPGAIPGDLVALRPAGFIWTGILVVMALPIGRVVVAGAGFYAAGERRLALISVLVIVVVGLSIVAASRIGA
jgi:uncharacterized membrane protein